MHKKIYIWGSIVFFFSFLSAFTSRQNSSVNLSKKPTTLELKKLGVQMASTLIRGAGWPTKVQDKGCWLNNELPNINIENEIYLEEDFDKSEASVVKMKKIVIVTDKKAKKAGFKYTQTGSDSAFVYRFFVRASAPKKLRASKTAKIWIRCQNKKKKPSKCRKVPFGKRQAFEILGRLSTPQPGMALALKRQVARGSKVAVAGHRVSIGDTTIFDQLKLVRHRCAASR